MDNEINAYESKTTPSAIPLTRPAKKNNELVLSAYGKVMENEQAVLYQYRGHAGEAILARLIR